MVPDAYERMKMEGLANRVGATRLVTQAAEIRRRYSALRDTEAVYHFYILELWKLLVLYDSDGYCEIKALSV